MTAAQAEKILSELVELRAELVSLRSRVEAVEELETVDDQRDREQRKYNLGRRYGDKPTA